MNAVTLDQFTAMERARAWAARHNLTVYKTAYKVAQSVPHIELHFVTPQVAKRHLDLIAQLSAEIGLPVTYATEPKPAYMSEMLASILPPSWNVSKSHSLMKEAGQFVIKAFGAANLPRQEVEDVRAKFAEMTGYMLVVHEA
ncbi:hypothetical protein [Brevibacillus borstelensis]|uniref:hypothetical protein n=1 Tax=Brevibacillus borstelensis TaxID=45462 RepID=UPI00046AD23C|nr:hypothetical protein [Brevibacillus borstelensis]MCC0566541.1 hypothetical protein [Brevibacillus borstelensis]MCM3473063.1 hypothetical protein [Brevibacillus borstelensis]MCM3561689.1 hypothetical protein [Brevibacillus borstelensis]MED1852991.1 hypothetical protein [Brevibacillus borstelensis]